jgi:hypothetical protein
MITKPFRIALTDEDINRAPKVESKDFCQDWMDLTRKSEESWNQLTEEEKKAWQKENCITEKWFCRKDGRPYMKWFLNTDWTWNIWDMEKGIEYFKCYPVSTSLAKGKDIETDEIIEEIFMQTRESS